MAARTASKKSSRKTTSRAKSPRRKTSKSPDAIALLKADHRKVEDLFAKYEKARDASRKKALAGEICLELTVHAKVEEDIFYPACQGEIDEGLWHEAFVEHDGAKVLIRAIEASSPDDEFYDAKVKVLSEMIKHHVKEEEKKQGNMFAQAKRAGVDTESLGMRLAEEKQRLAAEYKANGLPSPTLTTMTEA
jgi:hemerythrin superfamily protein